MNRLRGTITTADQADNVNSDNQNSLCSSSTTAELSAIGPAAAHSRSGGTVFTALDRRQSRSLVAPLHYEAGYAYPLVIWLHGNGGDEQQLEYVLPYMSLRNYVAAAPRGTSCAVEDIFDDAEYGQGGYVWRQTEDDVFLAHQRVLECVEQARRQFNIHAGRVFLAGYQSGGTMALRLALAAPEVFAGAISMCGPLPKGGSPLGRLDAARHLPVLLSAGLADPAYPQHQISDDLSLLHCGGFVTTLRLYPGADELTNIMLDDVNRWIMEHVCPPTVKCNCPGVDLPTETLGSG
jgi:phospholipase/carboxylesterase